MAERLPPKQSVSLNTMPTVPPVPAELVDAAERSIPELMMKTEDHHGRFSILAADLANRITNVGHTPFAARWAIHQAIQAGRLRAEAITLSSKNFGTTIPEVHRRYEGPMRPKGIQILTSKPTAKRDPVPYDWLTVTADVSLWAWYRSIIEDKPRPGRKPDSERPKIVKTVRSARAKKILWKDIPAIVKAKHGGRILSVATLKDYLKPRRSQKD